MRSPRNTNLPVVPYMMNTPYMGAMGYSMRRGGYMHGVNNMMGGGGYRGGFPGMYGGMGGGMYGGMGGGMYGGYPYMGYGNIPLNKETQTDASKSLDIYGNRNKRYVGYLRRWETELTDFRTATVDRNTGEKFVHTPVIFTEKYHTDFEMLLYKWMVRTIAVLAILLVVVGFAALKIFGIL